MSDTGNTELDHRGAYANPRYINDLQSTTKFHPSELPADPEAIRRFPKHLIDPESYTESPGSDSSIDARLERAKESFLEHAHKWGGVEKMKEVIDGLMSGNSAPSAPPAVNVASITTDGPVASATAEDAPNVPANASDAEVEAAVAEMPDGPHTNTDQVIPLEGAVGQTDAGPTGVPGAEQAATDVPAPEGEGEQAAVEPAAPEGENQGEGEQAPAETDAPAGDAPAS